MFNIFITPLKPKVDMKRLLSYSVTITILHK